MQRNTKICQEEKYEMWRGVKSVTSQDFIKFWSEIFVFGFVSID
jgi:hypothetical protein